MKEKMENNRRDSLYYFNGNCVLKKNNKRRGRAADNSG